MEFNSNWKEVQSPNVMFDHYSKTIWADVFVFVPVFVFELGFVKVDRDCQTRAIQAVGHNRDCWQLTGILIGEDSRFSDPQLEIQDCRWLSSISSMIVNLSQVLPNLCLVRSIWAFLRLRSRGLIFVWGTRWNCLSLEIWKSLWPESHLPIVFRSNCPLLTNRPRQCFNCSIVRLRRHLFSLKPIVIQDVAFHWFGQTGNLVIQFSCQQLSLRLVACFEICFLASSLWELPEKAREDVFKCLFEALSGNFERQLTQRGLPPATRRLHLELSETVIQMAPPKTNHSIEKKESTNWNVVDLNNSRF